MNAKLRISFNVTIGALFLLAFCAILALAFSRFPFGGTGGIPDIETYQIARPLLICYDEVLYQCGSQIGSDLPDNCVYLGVIESSVAMDALPTEDLQTNISCTGDEVYRWGNALILVHDGQCWSCHAR